MTYARQILQPLLSLQVGNSVSTACGSGRVLMVMWNDTDIPLAYFITFRCYGTWLHGDARGSTDRFHNRYQSPHIPHNKRWEQYNQQRLKSELVTLNLAQRKAVEFAIKETCNLRNWSLLAINVRTNHIHLVVSIGERRPEYALNALKTNATRHLRKEGQWTQRHSPWADKGSKKYFWNERSVERAIDYVMSGQGDNMPEFDS